MTKTYELEITPQRAVPSTLANILGEPRFSKEEIQANPEAPMRRLVKDVLRVGEWKVGVADDGSPVKWKVTDGVLREIARQYKLAKANGVESNLYWGASTEGNQHHISARDGIAPIDELVVDGGRLFAVQYVNEETARELSNPSHKVSVKVVSQWGDGQGRTYPYMLEHVAIVDQPVVSGQSAFFELANEQGVRNVEELKRVINEMLKVMELSEIGSEVSDDDLVKVLETKLETLRDLTTSRQEEETVADVDEAALSNQQDDPTQDDLRSLVLELSNRIDALTAEKGEAGKDAWQTKLDALFEANKIDAVTKAAYEQNGQAMAFNLSLLTPLDSVTLQKHDGSAAESFALSNEPDTGKTKGRSDEDVAKALEKRGVKARVVAYEG